MGFLNVKATLDRAAKFFREDAGAVIGAYFDGDTVFIARLTKKFETVEVEAYNLEIERLAEKIALICKQKGWKMSSIGFCLKEEDAVTFQTEISNVPEKEIPALVKSWAVAQAGADAVFSFAKVGEELWMETVPKSKAQEFTAAFQKVGLNLRGLSVMPANLLTKIHPYDRTEFITEVVRNKTAPNLLATRGGLWNWQKITQAAAAIFLTVLLFGSLKLFLDYSAANDKLNAAKVSVEDLHEELALKKVLEENVAELHQINQLAAQIESIQNLNLLINLGEIADKDIRLTKIRASDSLELEGVTAESDALKDYLERVKRVVAESARLESSTERDGEIYFEIRASIK